MTRGLGKIKETHRALLAIQEERSRLVAPTGKELSALRKAVSEKSEARLRLENALITLEIVPEAAGAAEVLTGEQTGPVALEPRGPDPDHGFPGSRRKPAGDGPNPGQGTGRFYRRVEEKSGTGREKIRKLAEPYGFVPVEELERREEQARTLEARLGEHRTRLETLLAGETVEALRGRLALLETRITTLLTKYPEWENNLPDSDRLQRESRAVKEQFVLEVEKAEGEWEKTQISLSQAAGRISHLEGELARNQNRVQSLEASAGRPLEGGRR